MFKTLKIAFVSIVLALGAIVPPGRADTGFTVDKTALSAKSGDAFVLHLTPSQPADISVKVYDPNGGFVRAIAEKYAVDKLDLPWNMKDSGRNPVAPGVYTIRLNVGLSLTLDKRFGHDGILQSPDFLSPGSIAVDKQGDIFVLDAGTSILYKYHADGTPANDFDGKNKIAAPSSHYWGTVTVGGDGRIYLPATYTTSHDIEVYDGKTGKQIFVVGGFFGTDPDWKTQKGGFAYPDWVGLNGEDRLYATSPGYNILAAWDRRKAGMAGGLWIIGRGTPVGWDSPGDAGATDGVAAIYLNSANYNNRAEISKLVDMGDTAKFAYLTRSYFDPGQKKEMPLGDISGVACDGEGGLFVVERASSKIIKLFDNGFGFDGVQAFGDIGKDPTQLEFTAPHGVALSPDGKSLYIVEDGDPVSKDDSTAGLARVTKFNIAYAEQKELKVTVQP